MTLDPRRVGFAALVALVAGSMAACAGGAASPTSSPAPPTVTSAAPSVAARPSAAAVASALPGCVSAATLTLLTTIQTTSDRDAAVAFVKANKDALIDGLKAYKPAKADDVVPDKDHIYSDDIVYSLQKGLFDEATRLIYNTSGKWTYPVVCKV